MADTQTEPCPACGSLLDVTGALIFAERTCPVCGTPINVRRNFGHYELTGVVGQGGQGVVYRAVDNTLNRLVALKLLRTEYSEDQEFVKQFESEAQLTASINHPNVVRVYSFGADEGHVYLAMELVDKGTLDDLMETQKRIPEARALQIGIEIAQGLRAGYEMGLIHRDVKPGNILFSADGTTKIVDFGLAMFFAQAAEEKGEIWGTPYYLSPERLNKAAEDFRSDIYSLGATLFHAIAGRPPFEAEDASHVALKHLRAQAVSLSAFAPGVCNATAYVINRMLVKDVAGRQQSYDELIEQLQFAREEALQRARGGVKHEARVVMDDDKVQKAMSWVTLATLIVLVGGLIVGGLLFSKAFKKDSGGANPQPAVAAADFGPGWAEARDLLLGAKFAAASEAFAKLAIERGPGTPERAWAHVNHALAAELAGKPEEAVTALYQLAGGGTQASKYFHEQVAPKLAGKVPIPGSLARQMEKSNHEALGAFFFALKNYELGAVDDSRAFLNFFMAASPEAAIGWLSEYKELGKPLREEFVTYSLAADAWVLARNQKDREIALKALREMPTKLPKGSKLEPKAKELLAGAEKAMADALAERTKRNIAYKAKATASIYDEKKGDSPDKAVDGDPETRWIGRISGEKWLALDLGSPKQISRWVVKSDGFTSIRTNLNFTSATLQKSEDGKAWADVDAVTHNRSAVVDRVVPPFTARYVRLVSSSGGTKSGDDGFRVFEFELGAAADQATETYAPADAVATRFSTETDFIAGPIGDPGALGSAAFSAKDGRFTVKGAGADIWMTNDAFQFVWQPIEGDCEIVARVTKLEEAHEWTKAGVMIRSSLDKNASHAMVACGSGQKAQFLTRGAQGQPARSDEVPRRALPRWLKVVRSGAMITGFHSADGKTWEKAGEQSLEGIEKVAFVGLAACSHIHGRLAKMEFDNVTITKK